MVKTTKAILPILAVSCAINAAQATEISTNAAIMQAMDKVTGRVNKITVPVNTKLSFGDFSLVLRSCKKRPAEEAPENFAFVDVTDKSFGAEEYNIFRGWLISSTPGINAIEHPIYDVWLLECTDSDNKDVKTLTADELEKRDNLPTKKAIMDNAKVANADSSMAETTQSEEPAKEIHIKEFILDDNDIEKNIKPTPSYISETSASYVSDIEEGEEPENLLQFTQMQEVKNNEDAKETTTPEDDLSAAIDAEINSLGL